MSSLAIIGCGPGGYTTAEYAAQAGISVTIFEKAEPGGTCLNRGCIPTKVYCHVASLLLENRKMAEKNILSSSLAAFPAVLKYKGDVVSQLRSGVETLMTQPGISLIRGEAKLKDAHTVTCDGIDYTADNIIIATGSHPTVPPSLSINSKDLVDSTGLLNLQELPKHLVIIGAGVIGMEMASAFNAFGADVTVIEFMKECLPMADSDLAKRLRKILEKRGVKFYMQSAAKSIDDKTVTFEQKGKTLSVEGDVILCATGRAPNTEGIGLDNAGIVYDRHGIKTNDVMQTNIDNVYAIGDVNGRMQLAHAAEAQGKIVIKHILESLVVGRPSSESQRPEDESQRPNAEGPRIDTVPWAVFTTPELAGVGPTEARLKDEGVQFETRKSFYRANGKAVAMDATDGLVKIIYNESRHIIACHILGAHAADLVQEVNALINKEATIDDLDSIIHIHPTLQELL